MQRGPLYTLGISKFSQPIQAQVQRAFGTPFYDVYSTGEDDSILVVVRYDKKQVKSLSFAGTRSILFGRWTKHELNTVSEVFQQHGVFLKSPRR
jgi:hypothetical protein